MASATTPAAAPVAIRNILFATDFSPASAAALPFALALARRERATLLLTHVLAPEPRLPVPMDPLPAAQNVARLEAERHMQELRRSDALHDVACEPILRCGELLETIEDLVGSRQIDLMVLGTRGRGGVRKLVLGSVAERIFRAALCPVLTVGPHVTPDVLRDGRYEHILFATDFLGGSMHAWPYAAWLAERDAARLTLVHAVTMPPALPDPAASAPFDYEEAAARARHRLQQLLAATRLRCQADVVVRGGNCAALLTGMAAERRSSLIVMGVHQSRSGVVAHVPWSLADAVVCRAPCPVLTVAA